MQVQLLWFKACSSRPPQLSVHSYPHADEAVADSCDKSQPTPLKYHTLGVSRGHFTYCPEVNSTWYRSLSPTGRVQCKGSFYFFAMMSNIVQSYHVCLWKVSYIKMHFCNSQCLESWMKKKKDLIVADCTATQRAFRSPLPLCQCSL